MDQLLHHGYEPFEVLHNLFEAIFETGGFRSTPCSKKPIASWKSLIEQWTDKSHETDIVSYKKNQLLWAFAIRSNCTNAIDLMKAKGVFLSCTKYYGMKSPDFDVFNQEMFYIYSFFGLYNFPLKLKGFLTSPEVFIKALDDVDQAYTKLESILKENVTAHPIAEHLLNLGADILSKYRSGLRSGTALIVSCAIDIPTLSNVMKHLLESW
jgi:hypothetical protein